MTQPAPPTPPPRKRWPDPLEWGFLVISTLVAVLVIEGAVTHKPDMALLTPLLTALGTLGALLKGRKKDGDPE